MPQGGAGHGGQPGAVSRGGKHVRPGDQRLRPPGAEAAAPQRAGLDRQGHPQAVRAGPHHYHRGSLDLPLAVPDALPPVPAVHRHQPRGLRIRHLQPQWGRGADRHRVRLPRRDPRHNQAAGELPARLPVPRRLHPGPVVRVHRARRAGREPRRGAPQARSGAARHRPGLPAVLRHRRAVAAVLRFVRVQLALPASRPRHPAARGGAGGHAAAAPPLTGRGRE